MCSPPKSHHCKLRPVGSPWSRCLLSPVHTARRSRLSHTCRSGTAWCSSASQTGNMLPGQRNKQGCYKSQGERSKLRRKSVESIWTEGKRCLQVCVGVHLNSARAAVECRRSPGYSAVTISLNMDMQGHIKHPVITANRDLDGIWIKNFSSFLIPVWRLHLKHLLFADFLKRLRIPFFWNSWSFFLLLYFTLYMKYKI